MKTTVKVPNNGSGFSTSKRGYQKDCLNMKVQNVNSCTRWKTIKNVFHTSNPVTSNTTDIYRLID